MGQTESTSHRAFLMVSLTAMAIFVCSALAMMMLGALVLLWHTYQAMP